LRSCGRAGASDSAAAQASACCGFADLIGFFRFSGTRSTVVAVIEEPPGIAGADLNSIEHSPVTRGHSSEMLWRLMRAVAAPDHVQVWSQEQ
jgi:hypothetical protein